MKDIDQNKQKKAIGMKIRNQKVRRDKLEQNKKCNVDILREKKKRN